MKTCMRFSAHPQCNSLIIYCSGNVFIKSCTKKLYEYFTSNTVFPYVLWLQRQFKKRRRMNQDYYCLRTFPILLAVTDQRLYNPVSVPCAL
jgi:hypothetical protein